MGHIMADDAQAKKAELNSQLKDYILQWRDERSKEEEELKRLKEKQAKRKEIRAEQEKKVAEQKRAEELALKREEEEKKEIEAQEKKKAMEESRNACSSEGEGWQKITGPCHGCPQGNVQVKR